MACQQAGVKPACPQDDERQAGKVGESVTRDESEMEAEEGARAKARKTEAVPSARDIQALNLGRSGEVTGQRERGAGDTHSEQGKEEEKGIPISVLKDSMTKMSMANAAPSKRVVDHVAGAARRMIEQLGYEKGRHRRGGERRG